MIQAQGMPDVFSFLFHDILHVKRCSSAMWSVHDAVHLTFCWSNAKTSLGLYSTLMFLFMTAPATKTRIATTSHSTNGCNPFALPLTTVGEGCKPQAPASTTLQLLGLRDARNYKLYPSLFPSLLRGLGNMHLSHHFLSIKKEDTPTMFTQRRNANQMPFPSYVPHQCTEDVIK